MVLIKMREIAEAYLGASTKNAAVTGSCLLQRLSAPGNQRRWGYC
uniref:Uncharacterized protein n=1 Tax=Rhizophora mucronata TaxID=61149 RepID=A0A2P2R390_RHIMU